MPERAYRPLNLEQDWALLDPDAAIPAAALARIRPLDAAAAARWWTQQVCDDPARRHPQQLPAGHWLLRVQAAGSDWERSPETVAHALAAHFDLPDDAPLHWATMKECVYELPRGVLLAHWRVLLDQGDEGAFALDQAGGYAVFGPQGRWFVGRRT